jgi:SH3-like domain-containing protein
VAREEFRRQMGWRLRLWMVALLLLWTPAAQSQQTRTPPYWASIAASHAMMRTGPGKEYPATWEYRREDLPIRVVEIYKNWRKIRDPGGTTGWMQVSLLSDTRTALVIGTENQPLHEKPDGGSPVRHLAQPGVVGRITDCGPLWCRFDVKGRRGDIRVTAVHGLDPGESF